MEVVQMEEDKTPSWLSIITKAKRFNVHANHNNHSAKPTPEVPKTNGHPKKSHRRHRPPSLDGEDVYSLSSHPPKKVHINVVDLPSSSSGCSSSSSSSSTPSPGLLSNCGSSSSAEEESTSTSILSAFSSTSSSPRYQQSQDLTPGIHINNSSSHYQNNTIFYNRDKGLARLQPGDGNNLYTRYPHTTSFAQDYRERLPEISISPLPPRPTTSRLSNQISVIKSTRSFHQSPEVACDDDTDDCCNSAPEEEPQDLSIKSKPKRFSTSSSYTTTHKKPNCTDKPFSHRHNDEVDDEDDNCVQDLSFRSIGSGNNNKIIPTITILPVPLTPTPPSNNTTGPIILKSPEQSQPIWKVLNLSSLISDSSPTNNSKLKVEKPVSSNSNHLNSQNSASIIVKNEDKDDQDDEGDLVIADVFQHNNDEKEGGVVNPEKLPVVSNNEKIHDSLKNDPPSSPTKETTQAKTELVEVIEVKSRRGRRRKDEEEIGTRFDCFLCSFTGVKENVLKNHMIRMHTVKGNRGNSVKCTVCGYSCPSVEELRSHQELIHMPGSSKTEGKVAFYSCSHCTKKFRSQSQLDAHLRLIAQKQLWKDLKTRRMLN